jgi:Na+/melibiose symporter-like transporter
MTQTSRLPHGVVALGFVSLFMDTSSEMVHSLLPVFLVSVLGVGAMSVGIIEGIAEATAAIVKVFSGTLSDWMGRRKPLVLVGYGLAALTKPLFPLASGLGLGLTARFVDRIGKGLRGAPRDALVADAAPADLRGTAFGLFNLATGVTLLLASFLAGALWTVAGPAMTFAAGAGFSLLALVGLVATSRRARVAAA